jgi:hypothetical protein
LTKEKAPHPKLCVKKLKISVSPISHLLDSGLVPRDLH